MAPGLLAAIHFAAHKHRSQRRKGVDASPYINHPIAVAEILARIGKVDDLLTLQAAVLHDTIEDTETTPEELAAAFGPEVCAAVLEVTDDKKLEKAERKRLQIEHAPHLSTRAKLIKLADKISNVASVVDDPPDGWPLERRLEYFDWAEQVVAGLRGCNSDLEEVFDQAVSNGRSKLRPL